MLIEHQWTTTVWIRFFHFGFVTLVMNPCGVLFMVRNSCQNTRSQSGNCRRYLTLIFQIQSFAQWCDFCSRLWTIVGWTIVFLSSSSSGHAPGQLYTYPARCWRKKRRLNILEDPRLVPIEFKIGTRGPLWRFTFSLLVFDRIFYSTCCVGCQLFTNANNK